MFTEEVFDNYNDMGYFYLSNQAQVDRKRNLYFRTKEDVLDIYKQCPHLLMVLFVESTDTHYIPPDLLEDAKSRDGRVKIILIDPNFVDHNSDLYVRFNQIDPVINRINRIEDEGRVNFVLYDQIPGQIARRKLIESEQLQELEQIPYRSLEDVENIANSIKGRYRKVYVICFKNMVDKIDNILKKYSIRDKGLPNQGVDYILIGQSNEIVKVNKMTNSFIMENRFKQQKTQNSVNQQYNTNENFDLVNKFRAQSQMNPTHSTLSSHQRTNSINDQQMIVYSDPRTKLQLKNMNLQDKYAIKLASYQSVPELDKQLSRNNNRASMVLFKANQIDEMADLKKKYENCIFILNQQKYSGDFIEKYKPYITGQVRNNNQIQKVIRNIEQPNQQTSQLSYYQEQQTTYEHKQQPQQGVVNYGNNSNNDNYGNNDNYDNGNNSSIRKRVLFYKDPDNLHIKSRLGRNYNGVQCVGYKNPKQLRNLVKNYRECMRTVIANGRDIVEIEQDMSNEMGEEITIIRFQPHYNVSDYPRVRKILSTHSKEQLGNFINRQFGNNFVSLRTGSPALDEKYKVLVHDKFEQTNIRVTERNKSSQPNSAKSPKMHKQVSDTFQNRVKEMIKNQDNSKLPTYRYQ